MGPGEHPGKFLSSGRRQRAWLVTWVVLWLTGRRGVAQDHADYKFEHYSEDNGRMHIETHTALFEVGTERWLSLKGSCVYDAISGATPTGAPVPAGLNRVPTEEVEDIRRAISLEPQFKLGRHLLSPLIAVSSEDDYESTGLALNYRGDFNRQNTSLHLGLAHNFDRLTGSRVGGEWERKQSTDLLLGVSQVLTPTTLANVTLTLGTAHGYLADPYKGFRFTGYPDPESLFPEKRPGHRAKQILSLGVTQSIEPLQATVEGIYRFYHDSGGVFAHTWSVEWFQKLGPRLTLAPLFRFYEQSAADFYRLSFPGDPSDTETTPAWPYPQFFSADYRLSHFRSFTYGVGLTARLGKHLFMDAAYKRYEMLGLDGVTSALVYPSAHVYTLGFRVHF